MFRKVVGQGGKMSKTNCTKTIIVRVWEKKIPNRGIATKAQQVRGESKKGNQREKEKQRVLGGKQPQPESKYKGQKTRVSPEIGTGIETAERGGKAESMGHPPRKRKSGDHNNYREGNIGKKKDQKGLGAITLR